jgi:hypothetical protein
MENFKMFASFKRKISISVASVSVAISMTSAATAAEFVPDFTKLDGEAGGNPANTAIFVANLSNLPLLMQSLTITSNDSGGAPGKFSGFDLDSIKLSNTLVSNASEVSSLSSIDVFNFSSTGVSFSPGKQRDDAGEPLFGTTSDGEIDYSVATLSEFDANSAVDDSANGFFSLGDGGEVTFQLTSPFSTSNNLYLYIGEVGNNGEEIEGSIILEGTEVYGGSSGGPSQKVPEPSFIVSLGVLGLVGIARKKKKW